MAKKRERMFNDIERIERMVENNEVPTDIVTSNKLFEYRLEKLANTPGIYRDERFDYKDIGESIDKDFEFFEEELEELFDEPKHRQLKAEHGSLKQNSIQALEEPYPTECYNHGQLSK